MPVELILWIVVLVGGLSTAVLLLLLALAAAQCLGSWVEGRSLGGSPARSPVDQRVDALLRDVLDDGEYQALMTRGYLDVASSANADIIYRIPRYGGMVTRYDHGRATIDLCVQPAEPLPGGDVVVMHKLLIQASEPHYVATARKYPSRFFGDRYVP